MDSSNKNKKLLNIKYCLVRGKNSLDKFCATLIFYVFYGFSRHRKKYHYKKSKEAEVLKKQGIVKCDVSSTTLEHLDAMLPELRKYIKFEARIDDGSEFHFLSTWRPNKNLFEQLKKLINEDINQILQCYYYGHYSVIDVYLTRTMTTDTIPNSSSFCWHEDGYLKKHLKLFFYLTDVSVNNAPFQYHTKSFSKKLFSLGFKGDFMNRMRNSEQINYLLNNSERINSLIGKFGTAFIVNTNELVHRATVPTMALREVLVFELLPSNKDQLDMFLLSTEKNPQKIMANALSMIKYWAK